MFDPNNVLHGTVHIHDIGKPSWKIEKKKFNDKDSGVYCSNRKNHPKSLVLLVSVKQELSLWISW